MLEKIGEAIIWFLLFILSATIHEAAHAWAAKRGGDQTAYIGGQVSLNPIPHIKRQPLGMVVLPLISSFFFGWPFGYASTPYDAEWAHKHPRKVALMAIAGPATHLIIVIICIAVVEIGIATGFFMQPDWVTLQHLTDAGGGFISERFVLVLSMLFTLNLVLLILNLLPLPPLDGSMTIALFLKAETARTYTKIIRNPAFALIGILLAWQVFDRVFEYIYVWVINIIYWGSHYG